MSIDYKRFVPDTTDRTFLDSCRLMKANFTDPTALNSKFLKWLYIDNPFKKAMGYIAYDGDIPASQLFITFQRARLNGREHTIGIMSNGCTMPDYRKQGHFLKIFTMLLDDCRKTGIPFIWAYPNPASLRGFIKTGFDHLRDFRLVLIPVSFTGFVKEMLQKEKIDIMGTTEDVPLDLSDNSLFEIIKEENIPGSTIRDRELDGIWHTPLDAEQLKWRYINHPTRKYYILHHKELDEWIIIRLLKLFGMKPAVILKTSAGSRKIFNRLLKDLKSCLKDKASFLMMLEDINLSHPYSDCLKGRFFVPVRLSPRRFPLEVYPINRDITGKSPVMSFSFGDYEVL